MNRGEKAGHHCQIVNIENLTRYSKRFIEYCRPLPLPIFFCKFDKLDGSFSSLYLETL